MVDSPPPPLQTSFLDRPGRISLPRINSFSSFSTRKVKRTPPPSERVFARKKLISSLPLHRPARPPSAPRGSFQNVHRSSSFIPHRTAIPIYYYHIGIQRELRHLQAKGFAFRVMPILLFGTAVLLLSSFPSPRRFRRLIHR